MFGIRPAVARLHNSLPEFLVLVLFGAIHSGSEIKSHNAC